MANIKPQTKLPEGVVITRLKPSKRRFGIRTEMRAVGERGTESRLPIAKRGDNPDTVVVDPTISAIANLKL